MKKNRDISELPPGIKIIRVEYGNAALVSDAIRKLRGEPGIFLERLQTVCVKVRIPLTKKAKI